MIFSRIDLERERFLFDDANLAAEEGTRVIFQLDVVEVCSQPCSRKAGKQVDQAGFSRSG
jgi:hypothetical protein